MEDYEDSYRDKSRNFHANLIVIRKRITREEKLAQNWPDLFLFFSSWYVYPQISSYQHMGNSHHSENQDKPKENSRKKRTFNALLLTVSATQSQHPFIVFVFVLVLPSLFELFNWLQISAKSLSFGIHLLSFYSF